jgi:uncharacterized membrane protein YfcA
VLLIAVVAGVAIGLALGGLGAGGSMLTVPVLVYALGQDIQTAATASLIIVGVVALAGVFGHARSGQVRWGAGLAIGVFGAVTSLLGSQLSRAIDPEVLLLAFSGVVVLAAFSMLRRTAVRTRPVGRARQSAEVLAAALVVGFLTGLFGVGGGFIIVPALVLGLSLPMPSAVGTSLLVIVLTCTTALVERLGAVDIPWDIVSPFALAGVVGALVGKRLADRVSGPVLVRGFALLLLAVAGYVGVRAGLALW